MVPSLTTEFQEPVAKIQKLVQVFHRSPVSNDDNLQPNIVKAFGKEKVLICDSRTRWSSTIAKLEHFLEVEKEIKIALFSKNMDFLLSRDDKVNNLCVALKPVKLAIEAFSKQDADLLSSEIVIQFIRKKLDEANTPISQLVKQQFEKRIAKRRNINLIHLMKFLLNPDVLNQDDQFGNKIKRNIANFATTIIQRLFQPNEEDYDVDKEVNNGHMSDDIRNNNNQLTLAQELKCFIKTSDFQMTIDKGEIDDDSKRAISFLMI